MSDKDWPSRPPTLIPFDAVGAINDLASLVGERLLDQCLAFHAPTGVLYRVRYATESVETLTNAIGDGCQHVEFALIHPELRVASLAALPDGRTRLQWEPELPELETYELKRWDSECDPQKNCIMFQWMREGEPFFKEDGGKTVLIASSVESFIRAVIGETFAGDIEERRRCWGYLQQTWKRFKIRMAGGELHWLEIEARKADALASLWNDAQQLAVAAEFENEELPDWCKVASPTRPRTADTVAERLHHHANSFGVMWDVEYGRATSDLAAIDAGVAVLLAGFDSRNEPDERIGQLRNQTLPTSCNFAEVDNAVAGDPYLVAECAVCGHRVFPNGTSYLVGSGNVKSIYRKCTPGVVQVCIVDSDPETGTVWYDNGREKKPYPVGQRSAAYLRVLIDNPQRRRSGKDVCDLFPQCHPAHATTYKNMLPPEIVRVIHTNNRGSILTANAYREEPRPS